MLPTATITYTETIVSARRKRKRPWDERCPGRPPTVRDVAYSPPYLSDGSTADDDDADSAEKDGATQRRRHRLGADSLRGMTLRTVLNSLPRMTPEVLAAIGWEGGGAIVWEGVSRYSLHSLRTHILFVRAFPDLPHPALRSHAATFRSPPALPALKAPFTPPARPRSTITTTATTTSPLPPISAPTNTSSNANDTSSSLSAPKINLHLLLHRTTHPFTDLLSLPRLPHLHTLILSDPTVASPSSGPGVAPVSLNAESLVRAWGRLASDAAVAASRPPDTNTGDLGRSRDPPFAHLALLLLRGPAASLPPRGFAVLAQLPRLVLLGVERPFGDETGEEEGADDGGSGGGGKGGRDALPETYRRFPGAPSQTAAPHEGRTRRRGKATSTPDARGEEPGAGLWDPVPPTSVTGRLLMSAQLRCSIAGDPRRPGGGAADAMHKALQTYAKIADTLLDGRGGIGVGKAGTVGSGEEGKVNSGAREEVPGADRPIAKISLVLGGGAADSEGGGGGRSGGRFAWYKRREGAVPPDADTEGQRAGAGRGRGASGKMVVRSVRRVDIGDLLRSFEG